jgi:hypothetical protein
MTAQVLISEEGIRLMTSWFGKERPPTSAFLELLEASSDILAKAAAGYEEDKDKEGVNIKIE